MKETCAEARAARMCRFPIDVRPVPGKTAGQTSGLCPRHGCAGTSRSGWCNTPAARAGSCPPPRPSLDVGMTTLFHQGTVGAQTVARDIQPQQGRTPPPTLPDHRPQCRLPVWNFQWTCWFASLEPPNESLCQYFQLFPSGQAHSFGEDVVVLPRDLLQQTAIYLYEHPKRRTAVFIDVIHQLASGLIELARAIRFQH